MAMDYILSLSTFTISELVPARHVVVNLRPTSPFSWKAGYRRTQPGLIKGSFTINIFRNTWCCYNYMPVEAQGKILFACNARYGWPAPPASDVSSYTTSSEKVLSCLQTDVFPERAVSFLHGCNWTNVQVAHYSTRTDCFIANKS